jgi:hypothetical protein
MIFAGSTLIYKLVALQAAGQASVKKPLCIAKECHGKIIGQMVQNIITCHLTSLQPNRLKIFFLTFTCHNGF